jgi:hypothetical protein
MAIYEQSTLGEPDNQIIFNNTATDPFFRALTRLPQKYQLRESDIPVPFQSGISDFLTLIGDTIYVITGKMYPSSEQAYDAGRQTLAAVSSLDIEQADPFSNDEGYVPYVWGDFLNATASKQLFLKVLYCDMAEDTRQGYAQPFKLVCKIKDPTIYGAVLKQASTANANPSNTVGTFVLPTTLPAPIGITEYNVSANANNIGNIPSYPTSIVITGPVTNPSITNSATGQHITVNATLSTGSDVLTIIYSKDSFSITKNGVNYAQYLTSDSVLFKIMPGSNIITLNGGLSTGANAVLSFYDSWALA